jgi:hypothetical protein
MIFERKKHFTFFTNSLFFTGTVFLFLFHPTFGTKFYGVLFSTQPLEKVVPNSLWGAYPRAEQNKRI